MFARENQVCYIRFRLEGTLAISQELLDLLVCPTCKTPVKVTADEHGLACPKCRVIYPVRDGIPVMIKDEAKPGS